MSDPIAIHDNSDRTRLLLKGSDRAKFLHNLTTNEVKRLKPGEGREAFVTAPSGKTLASIQYHVLEDAILVRVDPACRDACMAHFAKYGIFDDVQIEEITDSTVEWVVTGPDAQGVLSTRLGALPESVQGITTVGKDLWLIRDDPTASAGFTLVGSPDKLAADRGLFGPVLDDLAYEARRIVAGTPRFGVDVTPANLPQEIGRDSLAINFVKGCYLGQETVARLDALGHVNKLLLGAIAEGAGDVPPVASLLKKADTAVGSITSSAYSDNRQAAVALIFVKVPKVAVGDILTAEWEGGQTQLKVVPLPFPSA